MSQEVDRLELKADLYAKLGGEDDLRQAEEVLHGLVRRSPDQWSYYVSLLDVLDKRNGRNFSITLFCAIRVSFCDEKFVTSYQVLLLDVDLAFGVLLGIIEK